MKQQTRVDKGKEIEREMDRLRDQTIDHLNAGDLYLARTPLNKAIKLYEDFLKSK